MLFYSVFQTFHRKKNDSSVVLKSHNPGGPLGSYLWDVPLPALLVTSFFPLFWSYVSFCLWNKENKQDFLPDDKNFILAQLSQRLRMSYCDLSPSFVSRPSLHLFTPLNNFFSEPLGQISSNFMWSFVLKGDRKFVKMATVRKSRWPPCRDITPIDL